jgi:hypothetical protein
MTNDKYRAFLEHHRGHLFVICHLLLSFVSGQPRRTSNPVEPELTRFELLLR